jgi:hypothetical protein
MAIALTDGSSEDIIIGNIGFGRHREEKGQRKKR